MCKRPGCKNEVVERSYKGGLPKAFCSKRCKNVYQVTQYRRRQKQRAVAYKGGQCVRCGYNRSIYALDFHHVDDKDFTISKATTLSWEHLQPELDKCILLCANCHREEHAVT